MSEEFILKACKSFQKRVDNITEKKKKMETILSKFIVLCLSSYFVIYAGQCWRSKDEIISEVLLWTPSHGRVKAERPARTYIQQLCVDMGCGPEDLPEAMNDKEGWRERVRDIRTDGMTR